MMILVMLSPLLVVGFIIMAIMEEKKRKNKCHTQSSSVDRGGHMKV